MKKAISLALVICTLFVLVFNTAGLAWLSDNGMSSIINITGNMHKSYFQSGDGSQKSPFEIANPTQLYYFSWLQYLGYFNQKDQNGYIAPFYFRVSHDLDMTGLYLPPIGTIDYPFLGNFDGEGHTIYNLTIQNKYDKELLEPPNNTESLEGVEIIGFFGVIGQLDGDTSYTYDNTANQISNFVLENITVETQTTQALIGLVAGYVNGLVNKVGVVGSTVNIKEGPTALSYTTNLSDYTLIGYCADNYKGKLYSLDLYLYDPKTETYTVIPENTSGVSGTGWGGSVRMYDIYSWLDEVNDSAQTNANRNTNYYISRVDVIGIGDTAKPVTNTSLSQVASKPSYTINEASSEHKFGTFVFGYTMGAMGSTDVNFIGGGQKVTEYKYIETDTNVEVYYLTNQNNEYITFDGNTLGTSSTPTDTIWYRIKENGEDIIYTVYDNNVYYLTISGTSLDVVSAVDVDHDDLPTVDFSNDTCVLVQGGQRISGSNNSNYLDNNGTNGVRNESSSANAASWSIKQIDGGWTISTIIDENEYFLSHRNNSLSLTTDTSADTTWQYNNSNQFSYTNRQTTYYLRYNRSWSVSNRNSTVIVTTVQEVSYSLSSAGEYKNVTFTCREYIDDSADNRYYNDAGEQVTGVGVTYFPLSSTVTTTNGTTTYITNSGNTGYIIGAGWGLIDTANKIEEKDNEDSNIRISQYASSDNLNTSIKNPYTMTFRDQDEEVFSKAPGSNKNDTTQITAEELANISAQALDEYGLTKYGKCYVDFRKSIVNNMCYGLHFMTATVTDANTTRIDAFLNGDWISDYEVPLNCIDFHLYERGFINFLAGSYYTNSGGNNSFFSIYKIFRDGKDIIDIKEIYKIYGDVKNNQIDTASKDDYIYTYVGYQDGKKVEVDADGNIITDGIAGKEMIFNCDWITNPTEYMGDDDFMNKAFYFEVPVNEGEYAIGSTKNKTGAYLVYLDLAANAQIVERTRVDEKSYTEETSLEFPKGVSMLEQVDRKNGESYKMSDIKPENSAFISIGIGNSGTTISQNESIITDGGTGHTAVYIGSDIQLVDKNGKPMTIPISKTTLIEQSTYYDYNVVTFVETVTTIKKFTVIENGTKTIYYTKTVVATDEEGNPAFDEEGNPLSMDETRFEEDKPPSPDVPNSGQTPSFSNDEILKMHYIVADTDKFVLDHRYTETANSENVVTSKDYVLTFTNTGGNAVPITITLTELGTTKNITFKVVTGDPENDKVLQNSQSEQEVEVPVQPAENSSS